MIIAGFQFTQNCRGFTTTWGLREGPGCRREANIGTWGLGGGGGKEGLLFFLISLLDEVQETYS